MKIKITGCTEPKSWYRERIGQTFKVLEESKDIIGNKVYIVHKGHMTNSYVEAKDCVIVEETNILDSTNISTNTTDK